jgi:DNA-binding NarL/FixJ family response regulator
VAESGTSTLNSMRTFVGTLRDGANEALDDAAGATATRGRDVPALLETFRGTGLVVHADLADPPVEIGPALGLNIYRIVQEALTNVIRHGAAERAWVDIHYDEDAVFILIDDNGRGLVRDGRAPGHGLVGVAERAALHDGTSSLGPGPRGGCRLEAMLQCGRQRRWPAADRRRAGDVVVIRLVLADDQQVVRLGFRMILDGEPDMEVVGEAANGVAAIEAALELRPDVILTDVRMPMMDGIAATEAIVERCPGVRVLVVTTFNLDEYVLGALRAGAAGFLLKDVEPADLLAAIRTVMRGDSLVAPAATRSLVDYAMQQRVDGPGGVDDAVLEQLSDREREVLVLIARGLSNAQVADTLFLGETTVKSHVSNLLSKLHLRSRVQAVVLAYETGLVSAARSATTSCSTAPDAAR